MEETNLVTGKNLLLLTGVLFVLLFIVVGMVLSLKKKLQELQSKYDFFMQGKDGSLESLLQKTLTQLRRTEKELETLQQEHRQLQEQVQGCVQKVKLTRYDAYDAMGGEMSYSLLLADTKDNGVILTSIYGRDDSRCYAKDLQKGKSKYVLADEEKSLL